jgi:quinol monooxygenase YgiN
MGTEPFPPDAHRSIAIMDSSAAIVVVARWQTTEASLDDVLTHVAALRRRSLAEPGCLGYDVLQGVDEPTTVMLIERYGDGAALDAHRDSPHYRELVVERILPLLVDRRVEFLRPQDPP